MNNGKLRTTISVFLSLPVSLATSGDFMAGGGGRGGLGMDGWRGGEGGGRGGRGGGRSFTETGYSFLRRSMGLARSVILFYGPNMDVGVSVGW